MLTFLISIVIGIGVYFAMAMGVKISPAWSCVCGIGAFLLSQLTSALIIRAKVNKLNDRLQGVMLEVRRKIEVKQQSFMRRPVGSPAQMMKILEAEQTKGVEQALIVCEDFTPLFKWNFMLKKSINAMKMAFYYQLGKFDEVDKLLKDCLLMDPQTISMKMARMYLTKTEGLDKFYKKKMRLMRKDSAILPSLTYAWILVKQGRTDDAIKALADAKGKTSNEVLVKCWEALANGKMKQFTPGDLGETWYALRLEEIKTPKVQQKFAHAR